MTSLPQIVFAKVCSRYGQERRSCSLRGHCTEADRVESGHVKTLTGCRDFIQMDQLRVSANGIGDVLMGLTVGAGWKARNPGKHLHFVVPHTQWAELFTGAYDSLATSGVPGSTEVLPQLANRGNLHFVEAVARIPLSERRLPTLKPLPPAVLEWAEQYRDSIILAPISLGSGTNRDWPMSHWFNLERLLNERGLTTVVVGAGVDVLRLGSLRGRVLAGYPAPYVAAVMLASKGVVSNESGMGHLGGILGVPTLVLAAQLIAAPIYSIWPTVRVLQAPLPCGGCRWEGPNYVPACKSFCANLRALAPEAVLTALETPVLESPAQLPFAADAVLNAIIEDHLARLVAVVPFAPGPSRVADRRATMRAFVMAIAGKTIPLVVETGCQRAREDYGAGMSSTIFGLLLKGVGGKLVSLDNDATHVEFCRGCVRGLPVEVVLTDSRDWLRVYSGSPIDALYLDSLDTTEEGYQDCCLEEAQLALPHLAPDAVVMIDDTWQVKDGWRGKGALAIPWLLSRGWKVTAHGWQVLLTRRLP